MRNRTPPPGVFVSFGITGDLAKVMTFRALYRLEARGLLPCDIIGVAVDDWTDAELRRHMRAAIRACGERIDAAVFARLAARIGYLQGDLADPATYERLAARIGSARSPVFYLQTPPALFAPVVAQLHAAGLTREARVVIEKPFGHDLASARSLAAELHRSLHETQIFRVDHFLGKLGLEELLYLRYANAVLAPVWNATHVASVQITMAERFGVDDRGRFYDGVGALRDVVVNHLLQLLAAAAMDEPAHADLDAARHRLLAAVGDADPTRYVRGQYEGYRSTPGVRARSTTETYAALELFVDSDRWRDVPFLLRAGKRLPLTQTEVRLIFRDVSPLTFLTRPRTPSANELVLRVDPDTGIRIILEAHRADGSGPGPITLDMEFSAQGGAGPTPYEALFEAALAGDHALFTRQRTVEEAWRIVEPLLASPRRVHRYRPGSWGPKAAERLAADTGWRLPWVA